MLLHLQSLHVCRCGAGSPVGAWLRSRLAVGPQGDRVNLSSTVRISLEDGTVTRDGQAIHLTPNEQAVLGVLVSAKGRLVDRERLNALALGYHSSSRSRRRSAGTMVATPERSLRLQRVA